MKPFKRILVATDFSAGAEGAADVAVQLARQLNAAVDVVTVVDTSPLADAYGDAVFRTERIAAIHKAANDDAERFAARRFAGLDRVRAHVRDGDASSEIVGAARELEADLIVMGTHGRTGLLHLVTGSVADKVVRKSTIPVVTVRGPA